MGLFNKLFGKAAKGKLPKSKQGGHRGVALGIGSKPDTTSVPGRTLNRQEVGHDEVTAFLEGGYPLFVHSSNVAMAQYYPEEEKMQVEYLDGSAWLYGSISKQEARAFAEAHSKGVWIWDHIKVRGTVHEHQKPATQLR